MKKTFDNPKDYIKQTIDYLKSLENDTSIPVDEKLQDDFFPFLEEELSEEVEKNYTEYLKGNLSDYILTSQQFDNCLLTANEKYVSKHLESLIDKGFVEMGINSNGEIVYRATEKGIEYTNKNK